MARVVLFDEPLTTRLVVSAVLVLDDTAVAVQRRATPTLTIVAAEAS